MMTKIQHKFKWKTWLPIFLMGLPGFIYIFINNYMPIYGLVIAFQKYDYSKGVLGSKWVGWDNFEYLFKTNDAWTITRNTLLYNFGFIIINLILGVTMAIFLNEIRSKKMKKVYQTLVLLPYLMSMAVVSYLTYAFIGDRTGMLNGLLELIGQDKIMFYAVKKYWPYILNIVYIWRNTGYASIIYLATLVGMDNAYYEAAELDGATKWQQIRFVTLPLLKPTMIMLTTLSMGNIFRSDPGLFRLVPKNQGMLYDVVDTIDTYVMRAMLKGGNIGLSSAAAFFQSIVCVITIFVFNSIIRKISKEDALF